MHRRFDFRRRLRTTRTLILAPAVLLLMPSLLYAQDVHSMTRGGGGYLSLWKLGLIALAFLIWVKWADWINRDCMKLGNDTGMQPEVWNPINVGTFLVGFLCAISLPVFVAGYPVLLLGAFAGPIIYTAVRRSKVKSNPGLALKASAKAGEVPDAPVLRQDEGALVDFVAAGEDDKARQMNLIRSRQAPEEGYNIAKELIDLYLKKRADVVMLDFTRDHVVGKNQIDGFWHPVEPMNRQEGDGMLAAFKYLAGLNPKERRQQQTGSFRAITPGQKCDFDLTTVGTKTGERVVLRFRRLVKNRLTINQLGMWPDMSKRLGQTTNVAGLTVVSAMPSQGLTSTWQAVLANSDRITRDAVALIDVNHVDTEVENVALHRFDKEAGQTPLSIIKPVLLAQPDTVVVPELIDSDTLDRLVDEALKQDRAILTQLNAKSAAEALLKLYSMSKNRQAFVQAVSAATNQRLLRRLCDDCKVTVQVQPKMIQQLGGDPRTQKTLCTQFRLPPPEQRVDEKGRPIEFEVCETCAGIGYIGRIAAFETIFVDQKVREALSKTPNVGAIEKAARDGGKMSIASEAYKLVLLGLTTIQEVQRVMKD